MILYPTDESHLKALNYIKDNFSYASIIHDRDIQEDGTIKKTHIHCVIYFSNGRTISSLSKELDLPPNYINACKKDYKKALLYLIHYGENKVPYSVDEVEGDLKKTLIKCLNTTDIEDNFVLQIIDMLDSYKEIVSLKQFIKDLCNKGLYSYFRRSQYSYINLCYINL